MSREELSNTLYSLTLLGGLTEMLQVALELDVLPKLAGRRVTVAEAAPLWDLPETSARILAQHLCHMRLLDYGDGALSVSSVGELLVTDSFARTFMGGALARQGVDTNALKERLVHPQPLVWYRNLDATEPLDAFYETHHPVRVRWGEDLADQYDFGPHRVLLDVGGASGSWCLGVRHRAPHLRCILFELEAAPRGAATKIAEAGEEAAISVCPGS